MTWPDWQDGGKRVEVTYDDGSTVVGTLFVADFHFDGEDEVPHFALRLNDGTIGEFVTNKSWKFI